MLQRGAWGGPAYRWGWTLDTLGVKRRQRRESVELSLGGSGLWVKLWVLDVCLIKSKTNCQMPHECSPSVDPESFRILENLSSLFVSETAVPIRDVFHHLPIMSAMYLWEFSPHKSFIASDFTRSLIIRASLSRLGANLTTWQCSPY